MNISPRIFACRSLLLVCTLVLGRPGFCGERTIALHDYTGRGFSPDLVTYKVPSAIAQRLHLTDAAGAPVAIQIAPSDTKGQSNLSFVAALPPGGDARYTLGDAAGGAAAPAGVAVTTSDDGLVLSNSLLAIKVPAETDKIFNPPIDADALPAPIAAFRSGDGPWRGAAHLDTKRKIAGLHIALTARGPVYDEVTYELRYANGGYYRARIQVIDQVPLVKFREEYDAHDLAAGDFWDLDLTAGWNPDSMEIASTAGNGSVDPGHVAPISQLGVTPKPITGMWSIVSGNAWVVRSQLGLFSAADKTADPAHYAMAGFVPLHRGDWRRAIGVEIQTPDSKHITLRLPISGRFANWLSETSSETSPFSVNENEPGLPTSYGRRVWGLVLAQPTLHPKADDYSPIGPYYAARLLYGVVGLDRYKDFVLNWPDKKPAYPHVIVSRADLPRYLKTLPGSPYETRMKSYYFVSHDDAVAAKNLARLKPALDYITKYMVSTATMGHHQVWMDSVALADDVLSWPGLSAADREEIRAKLALITYLHVDADVMGHGEGAHLGNPNMSVSRQSEMCDFMALLPDHPMFHAWRDYMSAFLTYKFGINMAPGGGWFEFGAAYDMHSMMKLTRAMFGLQSADAPGMDGLYNYLEPTWDYYFNLLTPYDSRFYSRMIPGGANSSPGYPAEFSEPAGVFADRDPAFASKMQWAWDANGEPMQGVDMTPFAFAGRPWVKPVAPKMTSQLYPGVGVVFRAHQGPDETYMYFRSGYNWSHWSDDQNNFVLMSRGAVLVPDQPFQYYSRDTGPTGQDLDAFNFYNAIRFGSPKNQYAFGWPDSNIIDHAFGDSVDYAWSATGYPDWYIQPGHPPGFGPPRLLEGDAPQKQGAFTWNRQVMFMKGLTAQSPNYFVFRDTMRGAGQLSNWFYLDLLGKSTGVTTQGGDLNIDTEFPTKLSLIFPAKKSLDPVMTDTLFGAGTASPGFQPWPTRAKAAGGPVSPNWVRTDGKPVSADTPPNREQHVLLRMAGAPGEEYFWVAYPHTATEPLPKTEQLADGVMKITTPESTDYVFESPSPIHFDGEGVTFSGCSGAVRLRGDEVVLALTGGSGHVGYKGDIRYGSAPIERTVKAVLHSWPESLAGSTGSSSASGGRNPGFILRPSRPAGSISIIPGIYKETAHGVTIFTVNSTEPVHFDDATVHIVADHGRIEAAPGKVRFVAKVRSYAEFSLGQVAVRGMGPFDLTFTDSAVTGTIDGDTRTIVISKPAGIVRPMYHVDGVRFYAGFPDDDAAYREMSTPQYSLALGITAGRHKIEVGEWTFPALPPVAAPSVLKTDGN